MKAIRTALYVALAATIAACGGRGNMKFGDNEYPVVTVKASNAEMQSSYPATIKGQQDVEIRPKISGLITRICVQEGQTVGAGQLLFVIDNATYQAQVRQAQASVRQAQAAINTAKAQVNTAKLTYDNSQQLFNQGVVGSYELQTARNNYESAQAQVNQAQAALGQAQAALSAAQETLSFCYVKSPTNGVVGKLPFKVGALVSGTSVEPLTTISNIHGIDAYFSMTEKDLLEMTKSSGSVGDALSSIPPVKLILADGTTFNQSGTVTKASGVIDAATGSVQMIAHFQNPQHLLKSGGSATIVIPRASTNAIVVPQQCVTEVQDKHFMYLLGKDNKVKYTEVSVQAHDDGQNFVITSGLRVGDKYVTNGITKLTDGMEIVPITPEQYQKKMSDAEKLGENQGDAKKLKEMFK